MFFLILERSIPQLNEKATAGGLCVPTYAKVGFVQLDDFGRAEWI